MALSYPLEIEANPDFYRSMVEFKIFQTLPAKITEVASTETFTAAEGGGVLNNIFDIGGNILDALGDAITSEAASLVAQGKGDEALKKAGSSGPITAKERIVAADGFDTIKLYMPVGFSQTDTFSYTTSELGVGGALALGVGQAGGSAASAAAAAISEATAGITDTIGGLTGSGGLGQLALARIGQRVGGGVGAAAELAAQAVMNPNIRATFKAVAPRRYQFLFNFIPKSSQEAKAVNEIIYQFRKAAYPKDQPEQANVPLLFEYPFLFRIIPKVKTDSGYVAVNNDILYCYCESITVNTNPIGNNTYHQDGYPIQTDLSINLLEYRTISRSDVSKGYQAPKGDAEPPGIKVELEPNTTLSPVEEISNQGTRVFDQVGRFRGGL